MTACFSFDHVTVDGRRGPRAEAAAGGAAGPTPPILVDVSCTVPTGGITVISGPSGSGKSTLLRLCNRLEVPTGGIVCFEDRDVATLDAVALRRRVGMVFQRPTPFPGTGMDNLLVAAALTRHEAFGLADRVGLDRDMLDRDATTLSGGEAQRLCLARTLATGCTVLLADECTSALDPQATAVLEALARTLADGGTTVLWVTHDRAQEARLADHRLVLDRGSIVAAESDREVLDGPD